MDSSRTRLRDVQFELSQVNLLDARHNDLESSPLLKVIVPKDATRTRKFVILAGLGVISVLLSIAYLWNQRFGRFGETYHLNPVISMNSAKPSTAHPISLTGRFDLLDCSLHAIQLVANLDTTQDKISVDSDCTFKFVQTSATFSYKYAKRVNHIRMSEILLSDQDAASKSVNIGTLPLISLETQTLKSSLVLKDLQTDENIPQLDIVFINRETNQVWWESKGVNGNIEFDIQADYYDIMITSESYNSIKLSFQEILSNPKITLHMVPRSLGDYSVFVSSSVARELTYTVELSSGEHVCVLESESDYCEQAAFFSRVDPFRNIQTKTVVFQTNSFSIIEQKMQLGEKQSGKRLLAQEATSDLLSVFGATDAKLSHLAPTGRSVGRDEKVVTVYTSDTPNSQKPSSNPTSQPASQGDDYQPKVVAELTVSGARIRGSDEAYWYALAISNKKFILVTDDSHHPAQIYLDDGKTIVTILDSEARKHPQMKNIFATVVFSDDTYYNLEDELWDSIKKLPEVSYSGSFPKASYVSAGIINQNGLVLGTQLKGVVLEITADGSYEALLSAATGKGQASQGHVQTSAKGFKTVTVTDPFGHRESYKLCLYALPWIISNANYKPTLAGYKDGLALSDLIKVVIDNEANTEVFIRDVIHKTPVVFLTDLSHSAQTSFVLRSSAQLGKEFTGDALEKIRQKGISTRLNRVWFKEVPLEAARSAALQESGILMLDHVYLKLQESTFVGFLDAADSKTFEPQLDGVSDNKKITDNFSLQKITLSRDVKLSLFKEGKTYAGLFVKATHAWVNKFWPSVIVQEFGTPQRYYFNMDQVKAALGVDGAQENQVKDKRTIELFNKHKDKILATSLCPKIATKSATVVFRGTTKTIKEDCLKTFKSLDIKSSFNTEEMCKSKLKQGATFFINLENRYFKFDFRKVEDAIRTDKISQNQNKEAVYKCLDIQLVQKDANVPRAIPINATDILQGKCNGNFIANFSCDGAWSGSHTKGPTCKLDSLDKCKKFYDFVCDGKLNSQTCTGFFGRDVSVNHTQHKLESKKASVNIQRAIVTGSVDLSASSDTFKTTVQCENGYDIPNKKCSVASVENQNFKNGIHTKLKVSCKGILDIRTHDCNMGQYDVFICNQINNLFVPNQCNGTLIKIHCENGGTLKGCTSNNPFNSNVKCFGGYWNGQVCKLFPKYIITTSVHHYYTGDCQGDFQQNSFCKGLFIGSLVHCPDVELKDNTNLCENPQNSSFVCRGILTKDGCKGFLKTNLTLRNQSFETTIMAELNPTNYQYVSEDSLTKLKAIQTKETEGDEWKFRCERSFNFPEKTCTDAIYARDVKASTGLITRHYYVCKGKLNLETLECSKGLYSVHNCSTKYHDKRFPQYCNGTYQGLICANGGTPSHCDTEEITNLELSCPDGTWNGFSCVERPLHVIINNAVYVTGTCDGIYIENLKCKGKLKGKVILCHPDITSDNLCHGPVVDTFTCDGMFTKDGCDGLYSGSTFLRNASMEISSQSSLVIATNKNTKNPIKLSGQKTFDLFATPVPGWDGVEAECNEGYTYLNSTCYKSKLSGTTSLDKEKTYYSVDCAGPLDMENLNCVSGKFVATSCQTSGEFKNGRCDGTYKELVCANGGNFSSNCSQTDANNKVIGCYGVYENNKCTPVKVTNFPIIHISDNLWITGTCSSAITDNKCEGKFTKASFLKCDGDAAHSQEAHDSCKPVSERVFGECEGVLTSTGCVGKYTQSLNGLKLPIDKLVAENNVYNFEQVTKSVEFVISRSATPTNKFESVVCAEGFNPSSSECIKAEYKKFVEDTKGEANSDYQHLNCSGSLNLKTMLCSKGFSVLEACKGGIFQKDLSQPIGCLGTYQFANCTTGGGLDNMCTVPNLNDLTEKCTDDFFNGSICYANYPADYNQLQPTGSVVKNVDSDGKKYKKLVANFDSVVLKGGSALQEQKLSGADLATLKFSVFTNSSESVGSIKDIRVTNSTQVEFTKPKTSTVRFSNLDLDAIDLDKLAALSDENGANLISIKIKSLKLENIVSKSVDSSDIEVQSLNSDQTKSSNIVFKKLKFGVSALNLELPQVSFSFPPITSAMIKEWKSKNTLDQVANIPAPQVKDRHLATFQVVFRRKPSGDIYPFLRLKDLTIETPKDLAGKVKVSLLATTPLGTSLDYSTKDDTKKPPSAVPTETK